MTGFKASIIVLSTLLTASNFSTANSNSIEKIQAPIAKKIPHKMVSNGKVRNDYYYWMRDDSRTNPEVLSHLKAENDYIKKVMSHTEDLQNVLFNELKERNSKDDDSVPYLKNGYWYQHRFEGTKEYRVHYRKADKPESKYKKFIDENQLAIGHSFFDLGVYSFSKNNKILAYSIDTLARRIYTTVFVDIETGEMYKDKLLGVNPNVIWANDNKTVFYIKKNLDTLLGSQVYRHKMGTKQQDDVLVYEEMDLSYYTSLQKSIDQSTIFIVHDASDSASALYLDANLPDSKFKLVSKREPEIYYLVTKFQNRFFFLTNENAKNYKLMSAKESELSDKSKWKVVVPARKGIYIESYTNFNDYLVLEEKADGKQQMRIISKKDNSSRIVPFSDPTYVVYANNNFNPSSSNIRIFYSSLTTPHSYYDVDLRSLNKLQLKQKKVLGDFKAHNYKSEFIYVESRDGKQIPVSLVYRKGLFKKDGSNPLYQYAYGSYGSSVGPYFKKDILSLLDRGFVYAIAHVRGGSELGDDWYKDGRMLHKKNTFNDFIDVTKALVLQKYAAKDKVFASGASAGGLLMGVISNISPDLYLGISALVPYVDVVTTMLDPTIPLTTNEYDEWGNPSEPDQKAYDYMLSYSPYDQVKHHVYPNMLVTTGLYDSQVQYFEPAKWVAKLREYKTDDNTILFNTDSSGHGGVSGRFNQYKLLALEYAFFLDLINIDK